MDRIEIGGLVSGVALPFFNIPLILRMIRRKISEDLSATWACGVWGCILLMLPQALRSDDLVFKVYSIINVFLFSCVAYFVFRYKKR